MASPLEQFRIKPLVDISVGGVNASFTNSALMMMITVVGVSALLYFSMRQRSLIPGRMQSIAELSYTFVANMLRNNVGAEGRKYFPFVFTLFMFVLIGNMLGMIPYSFTFTSHLIVTLG
ncbi:MAG TPA: F0F1 ATP synthase subunit A, partial [Defluviicoccus sp.]|nr:F0F1 ATP synthase subunit A [Defluviicoccus sp.]